MLSLAILLYIFIYKMNFKTSINLTKYFSVITIIVFLLESCIDNKTEKITSEIKTETKQIDSNYMVYAAETNLKIIKFGQLARQKSNLLKVKQLGKLMEETHLKTYNELNQLAILKKIQIPIFVSEKQQSIFALMREKNGNSFNNAYMEMLIIDYNDAIKNYKKAYNETNDVDLKAWIKTWTFNLQNNLIHTLDSNGNLEKAMNANKLKQTN